MQFLERVAQEVISLLEEDSERHVQVVFPHRKPARPFLSLLPRLASRPLPAPSVSSIDDLMWKMSGLNPMDDISLLFLLFELYQKHKPEERFDRFYSWGRLMLSDFDDIDRYLVDVEKLFPNLEAARALEQDFLPLDFDENSGRELHRTFLRNWQLFGRLYHDLNNTLAVSGKAYPGMAYRRAAALAGQEKHETDGAWIFAGFNALSKAEVTVMQSLPNAHFFWDGDTYYLNSEEQEAGHFLRRNIARLGNAEEEIPDRLSKAPLDIEIIGVPLSVGQAKALGSKLLELAERQTLLGNTAIVTPDERLLLPVLHSLPASLPHFHVSGGFPLRDTTAHSLLDNLMQLRENYQHDTHSWYHQDVMGLLTHPLLRNDGKAYREKLLENIVTKEQIFLTANDLDLKEAPALWKRIFSRKDDLVEYLISIYQEVQDPPTEWEALGIKEILVQLYHLQEKLQEQPSIESRVALRMLRELLAGSRLGVSDEAGEDIQLMGMLETRCLSFDHVFLLSVNEGTLPATLSNHSFIPYDLRKAYGLPTQDEGDALYAYYFYHLLQGAGRVFLFYDSETGSSGKERSRYLRQLEYELRRRNPNARITHQHYSLPLGRLQPMDIEVEKDEQYYEQIVRKSTEAGWSPTYITTYFTCSLRFLLQNVTGLEPLGEVTEDFEASQFGQLYHELMCELYKDHIGKELAAKDIENLIHQIPDKVGLALRTVAQNDHEHLSNRNSIIIETVKVLAEKTLRLDQKNTPFRILALEDKTEYELPWPDERLPSIKLKGIIDRVDEKDGQVRIVDYKTGYVSRLSFPIFDSETEAEEEGPLLDSKNKEAFQTLFYAWLLHKKHKGSYGEIIPEILVLRDLAQGYRRVNYSIRMNEEAFNAFEDKLKKMLAEILDSAQPIRQTAEEDFCAVCAYNTLCLRSTLRQG